MSHVVDPRALRSMVEDSGQSFAAIEKAVVALRQSVGQLPWADPNVLEILRLHLTATGSPSDVLKYFSVELLERLDPEAAIEVYVQVVEQLARSPLQEARGYPVERAMMRALGERGAVVALPALAVIAGREVYPLSRTAARAVARLVGSSDRGRILERLQQEDFPEVAEPGALVAGVLRALNPETKAGRHARPLGVGGSANLRPESGKAREQRLRAIVLGAARDPSRCGNCDAQGKTAVVHVVPPSAGGTDLPGNLVTLCGRCQRRRMAALPASPLPGAARKRRRSGGRTAAQQVPLFG